jgi:hypothetical protein
MLIVSLSSVPSRFDMLGATLRSLLAQTARIDRILLYVPQAYGRFPGWDGRLPEVPEGVEIRRAGTDLGPATKVLTAAREFRGQDVDILYCDDDRFYPPHWAQGLLDIRNARDEGLVCYLGMEAQWLAPGSGVRTSLPRAVRRWRMTDVSFQLRYLWQDIRAGSNRRSLPAPMRRITKRSGYIDIAEGCGGVLTRPEFYDDAVYDIPPRLWGVDDIWLSGNMARRGIPIWLRAGLREPADTDAEAFDPLYKAVVNGVNRGDANRLGVEYMRQTYGVWP